MEGGGRGVELGWGEGTARLEGLTPPGGALYPPAGTERACQPLPETGNG